MADAKSTGNGKIEVAGVTAAPAVERTYDARNGPRTEAQLRAELSGAGYSGPFDVNSMLAAYN